jgi:hypothetical protein
MEMMKIQSVTVGRFVGLSEDLLEFLDSFVCCWTRGDPHKERNC